MVTTRRPSGPKNAATKPRVQRDVRERERAAITRAAKLVTKHYRRTLDRLAE